MRDIVKYPVTTDEIVRLLNQYLERERGGLGNPDRPIGDMTILILEEAVRRIQVPIHDQIQTYVMDFRGILRKEDICPECQGWGVKAYANTATYHHASIAGQAITNDICDKCWGSGQHNKPWPARER